MRLWRLCALLLAVCSVPAFADESGVFVLHKFAKAIGRETYSLTYSSNRLRLDSNFLFIDRGTPVPLKTVYIATDGQGESLQMEGKSSRLSSLHVNLVRSAEHPETFLIDGYSPVAMQEQMIDYWLAHGRPDRLVSPSANVIIRPAGSLRLNGKTFDGYTVAGLLWGLEALWMDADGKLVALISTDAEFDHFEAVREAYESSLDVFIEAASRNALAELSRLSASARDSLAGGPAISEGRRANGLAITNVRLVDGRGGAPVADATILIHDGNLQAIGPAETVTIPPGYERISAVGKTAIPGLWDMHAHYEQVEWGPIYLASGVTTVRDCGNEFNYITTVRDSIDSGKGLGPRILMAGIVDGVGPASIGAITANTPEQAIAVVRRYKGAGALQIKIYSSVKPSLVPVIAQEAHRLGMTVTGHVPDGMDAIAAVNAGFDGINHIQYVVGSLDRTLPVLKKHGTVIDPTLAVFEWLYHSPAKAVSSFEPGITHVAPQLREALDIAGRVGREDFGLAAVRQLHQAGVPIVAGTDQAIPGYSLHREIELYVRAGFTPYQALQSATTVPAKVMKLDSTLGTLEVGKRADLLLLDADPLADIANTRKIFRTIKGGVVYKPAPLLESVGFKP